MCCLDPTMSGEFIVKDVYLLEEKQTTKTFQLEGVYHRTPTNLTKFKTISHRILRFFQNIELIEKIAEIADESFHLFGSLLQQYTSLKIYQTLRGLHHGAHDIEHFLHAFCFLGDIARLFNGKFFEYQNDECRQDEEIKRPLDYLRSTARVCHAVAHLLATVQFLHNLELFANKELKRVFKYAPIFSAMGYALWTISLIWQRHQGIKNQYFFSDLSIHVGGLLFESLSLTHRINVFSGYSSIMKKAASVAGVIHAWFIVQRLMPQNEEIVVGQFTLHKEKSENVHPHSHCHDHHDGIKTMNSM